MKNNILTRTCIGLFLFSVFACVGAERQKDFLSTNIEYAAVQYGLQIDALEKNDKILIPRTVKEIWCMHVVVGIGLSASSREAFGICIILPIMNTGSRKQRNVPNIYIRNNIILHIMISVLS